ncbi:MAG: hypothetical protein RR520_00630 [Erysipelotrichaceae bacterium]
MLRNRIVEFWQEFKKIQGRLEIAIREENHPLIHDIIEPLNDQALKLFGCRFIVDEEDDFFELTFDTGGNKTIQYICDAIKHNAPQSLLENWIVNSYIHPCSHRAAHMSLSVKDIEYSGLDFKVYYTIDDNIKALHLKVYSPAFKDMEERRQKQITGYMLQLFVGELEMEARIASVEVIQKECDDENVVLLPNLYEDICDIIVDKDWHEYHDPTQIYSVYKLNEEVKGSGVRKDMLVVATSNPILFEEIQNNEFDSCQDLKDKEGEYGYIYYEHAKDGEAIALLNSQLEKEIHELLYPLTIARTIGSAIGTVYCYIELAIFDKPAFLEALKKMNEKLNLDLYYRNFMDL